MHHFFSDLIGFFFKFQENKVRIGDRKSFHDLGFLCFGSGFTFHFDTFGY